MITRILTAAVALVASLFILAGCLVTDEQARNLLASFCPSAESTVAHFDAIAAAGVLSQSTRDKGEVARTVTTRLCTGRETATTLSVATAGALVYVALRDAVREAEARGADVGYPVQMQELRAAATRMQKELARHGR